MPPVTERPHTATTRTPGTGAAPRPAAQQFVTKRSTALCAAPPAAKATRNEARGLRCFVRWAFASWHRQHADLEAHERPGRGAYAPRPTAV